MYWLDAQNAPNAPPSTDNPSLAELVNFLENVLTANFLQSLYTDEIHTSTLRSYYLTPGDIIYYPAGSLVVEKAMEDSGGVGKSSVGLRATVVVAEDNSLDKLQLCSGFNQAPLDGNYIESQL